MFMAYPMPEEGRCMMADVMQKVVCKWLRMSKKERMLFCAVARTRRILHTLSYENARAIPAFRDGALTFQVAIKGKLHDVEVYILEEEEEHVTIEACVSYRGWRDFCPAGVQVCIPPHNGKS